MFESGGRIYIGRHLLNRAAVTFAKKWLLFFVDT